MSSIIGISVEGLGTVPVHSEYTSQAMLAQYASALSLLVNVFNKTTADPITEQDYFDLQQGITELSNLLANGIVVGGQQSFVTLEMARDIQLLQRSLSTVGFFSVVPTAQQRIDAVKRWHDLSDIGLRGIMQTSVQAITANTSLQAIIELDYVRTGNDQLFAALSSLQDASQVTDDALNLLNDIQRLHNMVGFNPNTINNEASNDLSIWQAGNTGNLCTVATVVGQFRSDFDFVFNDPIRLAADMDPNTPGIQNPNAEVLNEYSNAIEQLRKLITKLDTINGTFPGGPNEANRAGTLAENLEKVLNDMGDGSNTAFFNWAVDGYNNVPVSSTAGNFQRRLTDAITTAESVNDQQRQDLRRELFLFEEFYRSASAMLTNISKIIERMASNISR